MLNEIRLYNLFEMNSWVMVEKFSGEMSNMSRRVCVGFPVEFLQDLRIVYSGCSKLEKKSDHSW